MITHKQDALYYLAGLNAKIASATRQLHAENATTRDIATRTLPSLERERDRLHTLATTLPERTATHAPSAPRWTPVVTDPNDPGFDIPPFLLRKVAR